MAISETNQMWGSDVRTVDVNFLKHEIL